jgi:hypothetical protein
MKAVLAAAKITSSIYEMALDNNDPQIIYDLDSLNKCSSVDKAIAVQGIKNLMVAGLKTEGKNIGILEIASPVPGDLNAINAIKIIDVLPLFSLALKRSIEDIENKVQAIIKENDGSPPVGGVALPAGCVQPA